VASDIRVSDEQGSAGGVRIIPIGGVGEIGKNMMLIEHAGSIVIIDVGMMFPDDAMPGVDFVIPDFSYVMEQKNKVRAIILTHGHEDHIGALPYLLDKINVPVYGTKLTLGFAKNRLEEYPLPCKPDFREIRPREKVEFGGIEAEFFRVCHSVADGVGIAFHTPYGCIVHTGDFKFEYTPINNHYFDFYKLAEFGEKGVLLLMSDSTNAENQGHTPSEKELNSLLLDTILNTEGRVLVATFASNVHRIQQIFNVCKRAGKKITVCGRSMERNISMAKDLGYLDFQPDMLFPSDRIKSYKKNRIVVLTTGSQGEPMSALSRIVNSRHPLIDIEPGDTVILSASIIPGNEMTVTRIVNTLFKRGAQVYYEGFEDLHVSGHASREELKLMLAITKPRYFLPIHGEFRHLIHHSNLAQEMGIDKKRIILAEDGDVVTISSDDIRITGKVSAQHIYIAGKTVGEVEKTVLKDRNKLSEDGIVIVILPLKRIGREVVQPDIISRGFLDLHEREDIRTRAKKVVFDVLKRYENNRNIDFDTVTDDAVHALKRFFRSETARSPMIVPIIVGDCNHGYSS